MNQVLTTLETRRSIRNYKPDAISKEILEEIVKAGTYAPTGKNSQSPIILVVTNPSIRNQLSRLNAKILGNEDMNPFYGAPVVLVVLADKTVSTHLYDGSLVMGNLMNAASSLQIGSCWIHRAKEMFETEEGKNLLASLGIVGDYAGIGNCILGYPEGDIKEPSKRKNDYVYWVE